MPTLKYYQTRILIICQIKAVKLSIKNPVNLPNKTFVNLSKKNS